MEGLIESIRSALEANASNDVRAAGAAACRTILTALEATPGEPIAMPTPIAPPASAPPGLPIAALVTALRSMSPDQLLDAAIARVRAALPPGTEVQRARSLELRIVPLQRG